MTTFPGEDYLTYLGYALTYPRRRRPGRAITGGITRFLDVKDFTPQYLDSKIKGWKEYVYVDVENKTAKITYSDPLSTERAGYWSMKHGTLEELIELSDKYGKIFVHIEDSSRTYVNMWRKTYYKRARWLYELQESMRDKLAIIPFGTFDYETYYCIGLAGGARSAGIFYEREVIYPDGRTYANNASGTNWGVWTKYREKYPGVSNLAMSFKLHTLTPILNKEFYDQSVPFDPYYNAKQLDAADISAFYFCRNFRDTGKPDAPRTKTVYHKGANATRPDQHRFLFGDGITCNKCSLSYCCKIYRKGGMCLVEGTEGSELVKKFMSDNAKDIVNGMQFLLAEEVTILEAELNRRKKEISEGKEPSLTPAQISKQINSVMAHGEKVAKLKDPTLTRPKVNVNNIQMPAIPNMNGNNGQVIEGEIDNIPRLESMDDREKQALIREMERVGYDRRTITQKDMRDYLHAKANNLPQIGAAASVGEF